MVKGVDILFHAFRINVTDQLHIRGGCHFIAETIHFLEFPARINVHERKRRRTGIKGLSRQMQHDRGILANGIEHNRVLSMRNHFPDDVDTLGFQSVQVSHYQAGIRIGAGRWL